MAKISILMPIYNAEKYLIQCLESIRNQTFEDFEVLMINDGSTDTSLEICNKYVIADNRFQVRHQKNQGSGKTRNKVIDWAMETESKYIIWIDADDVVHSNYLNNLYQILIEHPECDMVQCRYTSNENELITEKTKLNLSDKILNNIELMSEMISGNSGIDFQLLWNKIYDKELYRNVRMQITEKFSGRMQDDVNILFQIYKQSKGCYLLDEKLYFYRIVSNSIQHKKISEVNLEYLYIYRDFYLECKGTELDSFADYFSERILFEIASKLQKNKYEYVDYKKFYFQLKHLYNEFKCEINFTCKRKDLQLLNLVGDKIFFAFRIYALLYEYRRKVKKLLSK